VYAIERFHPLETEAPDGAGRTLDLLFPLAFLAERDHLGGRMARLSLPRERDIRKESFAHVWRIRTGGR